MLSPGPRKLGVWVCGGVGVLVVWLRSHQNGVIAREAFLDDFERKRCEKLISFLIPDFGQKLDYNAPGSHKVIRKTFEVLSDLYLSIIKLSRMEPQMARNDINSNEKPMKLQPQLNLKCNLKNLKLHEIV